MAMKRFFAGIVIAALVLGALAAPRPAAAADKVKIVYGHICMTDNSFGFVSFDGSSWKLDEEAWKEHCAAIANAGAAAVRLLPYAVWDPRPFGRRSQFCPWTLDAATDTWDLGKFNQHYFPIMKRVVEIVNAYGMEAWFAWFDQCQLFAGSWTTYSPWKHNTQGIGSFYEKAADKYATAWVRKIYQELAGCRVLWPWGNELGTPEYAEWTKRVIHPLIRELQIPFDRMTYGAVMGEAPYLGEGKFADAFTKQDTARKLFGEEFPPESNKFLLLREVHGCGRPAEDNYTPYGRNPAQASYWWANRPVGKFVLSDDGVHDWPNPADGGRPDAARWKAMATWALKISNLGGLEHLPEGGDLKYQVGVVAAIGAAYHAKFGSWPTNTGKWKYEPPPPPVFVSVTVCKASGLLPNAYCPEKAEQKYVKGTEPTKICEVHKKPDEPPPPPPGPEPGKKFPAWIVALAGAVAAIVAYFLKRK